MIADDEMSIAETAERFGMTLRTLRFYEQRGLIAPHRIGTARIYTSRDRLRLKLIQTGKRLGMSLTQIEGLMGNAKLKNREGMTVEDERPPHDSIVELLTRSEIQQQLQILERQRDDLVAAIGELKAIAEAKP